MAHSFHHAQSSARKFGGQPDDYQAIHDWFDVTKAHCPLPGHRALRHHAEGIFEAERVFGVRIRNTAGCDIPLRFIGEQHVREDCRSIPTIHDWLKHLNVQPWMVNGVILPDQEIAWEDTSLHAWRGAVAAHQTTMGYRSWCECQFLRSFSSEDEQAGSEATTPSSSARQQSQKSGAAAQDGLYCEIGDRG